LRGWLTCLVNLSGRVQESYLKVDVNVKVKLEGGLLFQLIVEIQIVSTVKQSV